MTPKQTLATICLAVIAAHLPAADYYVATYGNNANDGLSVDRPWQSIQHAINKTGPGDTINIRAGEYRGTLLINTNQGGSEGKYKTLQAYQSEAVYIKGSKLVGGWVPDGSGVFKLPNWGVNSQQVFVDGKPLQQIGWPDDRFTDRAHGATSGPLHKYWEVGFGKEDMVNASFEHGSFYYERTTGSLYVWLKNGDDPNERTMEVSFWTRPMHSRGQYVILRGLNFLHSNSLDTSEFLSGVLIDGSQTIMAECSVSWMDFTGVAITPRADSVTVMNCLISHNGNSGMANNFGSRFLIKENLITSNNYRNFNPGWHAGGVKSTGIANGSFVGNEISYNRGNGIWWDVGGGDWGAKTVAIASNRFLFNNLGTTPEGLPNGNAAIHWEISKNARILDNTIKGGRRGVYLAASSDCVVEGNAISNIDASGGIAGIDLGGVPRAGYETSRNVVYNNTVVNTNGKWDAGYRELKAAVRPDAAGNAIDFNVYFRAIGPTRFSQFGDSADLTNYPHLHVAGLANWKSQNKGGFDQNSVELFDNSGPVISSLTPRPARLWPANHKMVAVELTAVVTDDLDPAPITRIVSVESSEPVDGVGDGNTAPDWIITGDLKLDLRAERAGNDASRVYTITVESTDVSGNRSVATTTVTVPHDRGH